MAIGKKVIIILCVLLLAFLVSCTDDKNDISNSISSETPVIPEDENGSLSGADGKANEIQYPAPTAAETPAPPEQMESPIIPDDENVSMPDPG